MTILPSHSPEGIVAPPPTGESAISQSQLEFPSSSGIDGTPLPLPFTPGIPTSTHPLTSPPPSGLDVAPLPLTLVIPTSTHPLSPPPPSGLDVTPLPLPVTPDSPTSTHSSSHSPPPLVPLLSTHSTSLLYQSRSLPSWFLTPLDLAMRLERESHGGTEIWGWDTISLIYPLGSDLFTI